MIHRIDVAAKSHDAGADPLGQAIAHQISEFGLNVGQISTRRIFLIDSDMSALDAQKVARQLLADPIVETAETDRSNNGSGHRIEIHLKPGVMDPVAASTEMAINDLGLSARQVRTGRAYLLDGSVDRPQLERIAARVLANGVIESVHFEAYLPVKFEEGHAYRFKLRHVEIIHLDDEQLKTLSRQGHLFLSLAEMQAVQKYFRLQKREPTDIELETIAQTWSEHCVHKTLKSAVDVIVNDDAGKAVASRRYENLIKETIFASTATLMKNRSEAFCLSVFKDNAGVVAFDETDAICFKVETHNHPSAIEPYGGSATGVGGVIRDVLGTGLAAKPIANTDVFCVAFPDGEAQKKPPRGIIHPRRILRQIVAGVRDYGNRMGIPTVNGAVYFDDHYLGNPLVFCGCVGLIPRNKIAKAAQAGDAIVVMGGRTGRDGIHGATFSSAELTDTHADEFSHAVQIGNAITEKKVADVILAARDLGLFTAITDCGAGGLSSAVGEMGEKIGATVDLDRVPLKYQGLRYDEIWISEAQERMVLSVPPAHVAQLLSLAKDEDVEAHVIGEFGDAQRELVLRFEGTEVGRLGMAFIHEGVPMPTRRAVVRDIARASAVADKIDLTFEETRERLLNALAHPNTASKHWIIRQYDHEVQGGSVVKPLVGPLQMGPSDASVIRPKLSSDKGVALACGIAPEIADPYQMAIAAIDEAIRNIICVGAHPDHVALLDNFCWPSVDDEQTMGTLVRACEACRDAALAFGTPFISGKDSLHNQFTNQETQEVLRIPNTLLISAIGVIDDVRLCRTMDLKRTGSALLHIAACDTGDLKKLAAAHRQVASLIGNSTGVLACHDVSDGGVAVTVAEMCIASGRGAYIDRAAICNNQAFASGLGQYVLEIEAGLDVQFVTATLFGCDVKVIGCTAREPALVLTGADKERFVIDIAAMTAAWRGTLDW